MTPTPDNPSWSVADERAALIAHAQELEGQAGTLLAQAKAARTRIRTIDDAVARLVVATGGRGSDLAVALGCSKQNASLIARRAGVRFAGGVGA